MAKHNVQVKITLSEEIYRPEFDIVTDFISTYANMVLVFADCVRILTYGNYIDIPNSGIDSIVFVHDMAK